MKVTVIPIVTGVLGAILEGLVRGLQKLEIGRRAETIPTTTLKSVKILRRVIKT